ncbi:MAG: class I SAM-dependent methyltransferase [Cyclobacteriaceae bacterium]|nr:class I SAM-dependent methyltransferase [Cyclobacteriaceae bacterium]
MNLLLSFIGREDRLLDIGCGSGQFALLAAEFCRPVSITGIEVSAVLIEHAKRLFQNGNYETKIEFSLYNGTDLPEFVTQASIVSVIDVLHHIPKDLQISFLQQLYLKMSPGATLLLKDIDGASAWVWFNKFHDLLLGGGPGNEFALAAITKECLRIGFTIEHVVKTRMYWYDHYLLALKKAPSTTAP